VFIPRTDISLCHQDLRSSICVYFMRLIIWKVLTRNEGHSSLNKSFWSCHSRVNCTIIKLLCMSFIVTTYILQSLVWPKHRSLNNKNVYNSFMYVSLFCWYMSDIFTLMHGVEHTKHISELSYKQIKIFFQYVNWNTRSSNLNFPGTLLNNLNTFATSLTLINNTATFNKVTTKSNHWTIFFLSWRHSFLFKPDFPKIPFMLEFLLLLGLFMLFLHQNFLCTYCFLCSKYTSSSSVSSVSLLAMLRQCNNNTCCGCLSVTSSAYSRSVIILAALPGFGKGLGKIASTCLLWRQTQEE
jgi:hypothetical protein